MDEHTIDLATPRRSTLLAALLAALILLPLLGHRPLTDWDEGIYAEIAREMLAGHSLRAWLIPHWNGALWFEKPPLQMWLTAISLRLFGLNAFAARLPSALAGIAIVAILHGWLFRRQNSRTAWLSTLLLLSAFGFQHAARVGETDTLLSLFSLIAVLGLAELLLDNPKGWLLFFTAFAPALMTKGAASLTLPLTALALTALHPRVLLRQPKTFTAGLALFFALTLPWHVFVYAHFGQASLHDYVGYHTLTRATAAIEGHHTRPWFYFWVLLLSAPPFALLYPFALAAPFSPPFQPVTSTAADEVRAAERPLYPADIYTKPASATPGVPGPVSGTNLPTSQRPLETSPNPLQALALFALIVFILFTAASTRLPHYIAPAYPALSALTAALIAQKLRSRALTRSKALQLASIGLILYAAAALLTAKPRKTLHNPQLRDGYNTPDNRESVALLQQFNKTHIPLPPGPLLVWRENPVVPLTTDAFYAHHLAQQVTLTPPPANLPPDPYFNQPQLLTPLLNTPHLLLLDRSLLLQLPPNLKILPFATGPTQEVVLLSPVGRPQ